MRPAAVATSNPMSLAGRTVIVTGASRGIGLAIAEQVLALDGNVIAIARTPRALAHWRDHQLAQRVLALPGDVARADFAAEVFEAAIARFGQVDGLVNNAAISRPAMITDMPHDTWHEVLDVNLSGCFYFLQAAGRHFLARARQTGTVSAAVVNISSDGGRRGSIGQINYAAAKSGLLGLTMSAAREWGKYGVRVNSVCFGVVETDMTEVVRGEKFSDFYRRQIPMGRWASTQEAAPSVCFLLSDAAAYITGQHLSVNGGMHIGF